MNHLIFTPREKYINASKASEEINMVKDFCGKDATCVLMNVSWDTNFVFANGSKAPPWRQVYGDIGYINVVPKDTPTFTVLVLKKGYQVIKGMERVGDEEPTLNYEAEGDKKIFTSLIELLRTKSPHFSTTIEKQKYKFQAVPLPTVMNQTRNSRVAVKSAGKDVALSKSTTQKFEKNEPSKQANQKFQKEKEKERVKPVIDQNSKWK